jgi:hypothetical protein
LNDEPVQRLKYCPIEHTASDLYPESPMSADSSYCLDRIKQGKNLCYADALAAMAIVDMCESCSDFAYCLKKRRAKTSQLLKYINQKVL